MGIVECKIPGGGERESKRKVRGERGKVKEARERERGAIKKRLKGGRGRRKRERETEGREKKRGE